MSVKQPKISVNKLAEFMVSKAARQRKLLRDRKYPDPEFSTGMYHREATEAVARYLISDQITTDPIDSQLQILQQKTPSTIGTQRRLTANVDALERFLDMLDDFDFGDCDTQLGEHAPPKLTFHGVQVSVRPDIILRSKKKGKRVVGAVKLHFPKSFSMTDETAGYVSAAVQEFCIRHVASVDEKVDPTLCHVLDVGSAQCFPGVKATKARLKDIEDTCRNIADIWPNL
jgi:hypothetical protein